MSEMVERVAKAIEATMFAPHELPCPPELHAKYRTTARAAIAEMRKPTEKMVRAAANYRGTYLPTYSLCEAIIKAALE